MKRLIALLYLLVPFTLSARDFDANRGGTNARDYFVALPYQFDKGLPVVEVSINGKKYKMLFDTGALTAVTEELAAQLNLPTTYSIPVGDSGGLLDSLRVVTLPPLDLGGVVFNDVPAVVLHPSLFTTCIGVDAIIGSNMLRNSIVQFVPGTQTIILTDQLKKLSLGDAKGLKIELNKNQSTPYLPVVFHNGKTEGKEWMLFDSGSNAFYDLGLDVYKRLKPQNLFQERSAANGSGSLGIHGVDQQVAKYKVAIPELNINNYAFRNLSVTTTSGNSSRIGAKLLSFGDVVVDYRNKKFYFLPGKDTAAIIKLQKSWPVDFVPGDGKLVIGTVWEPGLQDKINLGDELVQFGDKNFEQGGLCDFAANFRQDSDTANLVLRDKQTKALKTFTITRQ